LFNKNIMMLHEIIKIEIDNKYGFNKLPRVPSKVVSILLASLSLSFSKLRVTSNSAKNHLARPAN